MVTNTSRRAFVGVVRSDTREDGTLVSLRAAAASTGMQIGQWHHAERADGHVYMCYGVAQDCISLEIASRPALSMDCFGYPIPGDTASPMDTPLAGCNGARESTEPIGTEETALPDMQDLDGAYVLIKVDGDKNEITLFRDKFGQRQLYYFPESGRLWFSDNIRFLLAIRESVQVRHFALVEWIHYGIPLSPETLFEGVLSVPGGCKVTYNWENESRETSEYFNAKRYVSAEAYRAHRGEKRSELERDMYTCTAEGILRGARNQKAVSLLLSGGVDSSALAAILAQSTEVEAVTVDMYGPNTESELVYAQKVAAHVGIDLAVSRFGRAEFRRSLCDVVFASASPVIVANAVALYHVAATGKLTHGQLILDGEMADSHHFGSMRSHKYSIATHLVSSLLRIPPSYVRRTSEYGRRLISKFGLSTRSSMDGRGLSIDLAARGLFRENRYRSLLDVFAHLEREPEREICALGFQVFQEYLQVHLQRIDVMASMVESSVVLPFLLGDIFEYLANLPVNSKIRPGLVGGGYHRKWMWKRVVSKLVPPEVVYRPKMGFGIPGGSWCDPMPKAWLADSWVGNFFRIPNSELVPWWQRRRNSNDAMFFATMEIWGRLLIEGEPLQRVRDQWLEAE
jgi:asparagine synthetase B (glutamine-hydrolysing)